MDRRVERAQGCMLGQLAGDALGSQVEFMDARAIRAAYPGGVREMKGGGPWRLVAGQLTDDSEMALMLARMLARDGGYNAGRALTEYQRWLATEPFDVGVTVGAALRGLLTWKSEANGALMRVSPLGLFGARLAVQEVEAMARADAALTHPNRVCVELNGLFAGAVALAVRTGASAGAVLDGMAERAEVTGCSDEVRRLVAGRELPVSFTEHEGWVRIAFANAVCWLAREVSVEEAVVATVGFGGDTDTNAAIVGALLGAVQGVEAVPARWREVVLGCRPEECGPGVLRPRPEILWGTDAMELAMRLVAG